MLDRAAQGRPAHIQVVPARIGVGNPNPRPDPTSSLLEWAVGRSAELWQSEWRPWLVPYLLLAAMAFVPLGMDSALARVVQVQIHRIGGAAHAGPPPFLVASPVFDVAWAMLVLVAGAGIARGLRLSDGGRTPVWRSLIAGVREMTGAIAPWSVAGALAAVAARALFQAAPGGAVHDIVAGAAAVLAVLAWAWTFWLVAAGGLGGSKGARAAHLWRMTKGRRLTFAAGAALWAVGVGLIGMLAAAVAWSLGLWGGSVFYALVVAGAWLVAVRASMLFLELDGGELP